MPSSLGDEISELEAFPLERLPEEQRRVVRDKLEALKRVLAANPLQLAEPYEKQRGFLAATEQLKGFFGGNGAGKSWVGTLDDCIQLVDRDAVPKHLRAFKHWDPPFFLRVVVPKQKILDTKTIPEFRAMLPASQLKGGSFDKAYKGSEGKLYLANGSWVVFNTSDQDRDAHAAIELHRCRFDEEPEGEHGKGIYTENVARLRKFLPHAQISFTMTPLFGLSWTYDEIWERRDDPDVHCTVASMLDNPHINAEATIKALGHLSSEERRAVVEGEFVHFHGAVIDLRDEHVVPPPDRLHVRGLDVYVGIDPGIARGGVVWCGFDRDNVLLVFDELYPEGLTVEQITKLIRAKNALWGIDPRFFVIDPSARNRSLTNAQSVEAEFQRNGIFPIHGQNDRAAGILQLRGRLEHGGLLVAENCKAVRYEAKRWLVAKDEKSSEESASGDQFVTKGPDHCLVPGTLVLTESGSVPIEDVRAGGMVQTRAGLREVLAAGITNPDVEVFTLELEEGRSITATGDHPVWVEGQGMTPVDAVRYGDILWVCPESKWLSSTGSSSAGTPTLLDDLTGCTSPRTERIAARAWGAFTKRSGSRRTGRSLPDGTSITSTTTPSTTTSATFGPFRRVATWLSTGPRNAPNVTSSTSGASARGLLSGTARAPAGRGTLSRLESRWRIVPHSMVSATSAEPTSSSPLSRPLASALTTASRSGGDSRASMTSTATVLSAGSGSASTATSAPRLVRVHALGLRRAGRSVVYDLTVADQHEFFANGVLVSNCWDPIRYCAMERLWFEPTRRKRVTRARHPDEMPAWNGVPQSDGVDVPPSGVWS